LEQILGLAEFAAGRIGAFGSAVEKLETIEDRDSGDVRFVAGVELKLAIDQREGLFFEAEMEEGKGFFELGFRFAKDHFRKIVGADRFFGRPT
jgi:hypothetical protein